VRGRISKCARILSSSFPALIVYKFSLSSIRVSSLRPISPLGPTLFCAVSFHARCMCGPTYSAMSTLRVSSRSTPALRPMRSSHALQLHTVTVYAHAASFPLPGEGVITPFSISIALSLVSPSIYLGTLFASSFQLHAPCLRSPTSGKDPQDPIPVQSPAGPEIEPRASAGLPRSS
jgi:hypothetical protein